MWTNTESDSKFNLNIIKNIEQKCNFPLKNMEGSKNLIFKILYICLINGNP